MLASEPSSKPRGASRVFLVDDHPSVRRGMSLLLSFEPSLEVCGEAEDAEDAFAQIRRLAPNLAIVDLTLKRSSGLELILQLRAECPAVKILVVSMHDEARWVELALRAGAQGYLTKDECPDQLVQAIGQVLAGRRFLSQRVLALSGGERGPDSLTPEAAAAPDGCVKRPAIPSRKRSTRESPGSRAG